MSNIAIYLPTYKRPHSLVKVFHNLFDTTFHSYKCYFGLEEDDKASYEILKAHGANIVVNKYEPGYSNTIQTIYEQDDWSEFFMHANDDFEFTPDWDVGPVKMFDDPNIMVVGLRQRQEDRDGSAVCMVRKSYIKDQSGVIDMPNRVFYPYHHNYIDTEFTQTAQHRGVWAKYPHLVIGHNHPGFVGGDKDQTYLKNDATSGLDQKTFESRRHLWT